MINEKANISELLICFWEGKYNKIDKFIKTREKRLKDKLKMVV
jgi:hypothetical protein